MTVFDILLYVVGGLFLLGWSIIILDAISGFRLIEKFPKSVMSAFYKAHNWAWFAVGIVLLAMVIVKVSEIRF